MKINVDFFAERPDKKSSSTFPRFGKPRSGGGLCPKEFSMSTGIPFDREGLTSNLFLSKQYFDCILQRRGPHLHPQSKNKDIGVYLASIL